MFCVEKHILFQTLKQLNDGSVQLAGDYPPTGRKKQKQKRRKENERKENKTGNGLLGVLLDVLDTSDA